MITFAPLKFANKTQSLENKGSMLRIIAFVVFILFGQLTIAQHDVTGHAADTLHSSEAGHVVAGEEEKFNPGEMIMHHINCICLFLLSFGIMATWMFLCRVLFGTDLTSMVNCNSSPTQPPQV
jgi:hypothetical protein